MVLLSDIGSYLVDCFWMDADSCLCWPIEQIFAIADSYFGLLFSYWHWQHIIWQGGAYDLRQRRCDFRSGSWTTLAKSLILMYLY